MQTVRLNWTYGYVYQKEDSFHWIFRIQQLIIIQSLNIRIQKEKRKKTVEKEAQNPRQ